MTMVFTTVICSALSMFSPERYNQIIDSIHGELANAKTPKDSVHLLFDLFDLAPYNNRVEAAEKVYQTARRAGDINAQREMCLKFGEFGAQYSDSTLYNLALERIALLPPSEERDITECHIKCLSSFINRLQTEKELSDEIQRLMTELNNPDESSNLSNYDRIVRMFNLADYIQGFTEGTFLTEYLDQLEKEIARLPSGNPTSALQYKFYSTAALSYMRNEQFDKAVKTDKKILSAIDRMERENKSTRRKFRDFNLHRFISYRRMLKCYPALSESEVESIYDAVKEMAQNNQDISDDIEEMPVPEMALYMKKGEYEKALPYLTHLVERAGTLYDKKYYLRRTREAAKATNNAEILSQASNAYADILEEYIEMKTAERMRELQINYQFQSLRDSNEEELRKRERLVTILAIIASALLIIVVIVFIIMSTRQNRQKHKLARINAKLETDAVQLRETTTSLSQARDKAAKAIADKSQLVNYMTNEVANPINAIIEYSQMIIDNVQGENKEYLERFMAVVNMNIRMLQGLIADVQELAMAENDELPINRAPVDLNVIGELAVESIIGQVHKGVEMTFIPANGGAKTIFNTDARRTEIILLNLLNNAAKFTHQGSITLDVNIDSEGNAVYRVTDSGKGIPSDKSMEIFKRFEKLDQSTPGAGLGLSICELVARALDATVYLDTDYPGPGSRFILKIHPHA
ncbi:MAG: HAMP domain-containing histidine kinase [Muribaculaceae bacterium]|nr:HAMP domain-containing histidine kinase [Muribaculaceae bacterium]